MPTTSANTSLLSVYLVYILALGMISVVLTICVLECHHSDPETKVPKWLLKTVNILMIFSFQKKKDQSRCCYSNRNNIGSIDMSKEMSAYVENEEKKTAIVQEPKDGESIMEYSWLEVGRILDKSFLKISLFIVLTTTLLLMMALTIDYVIY
ncbi:Acetylcholine receptor subunit alpha-1-A [Mizuhopecten yessoensis]|uniref:Acetylcholine receptor subunit alpha-1-A n=1 Tax=Mizuhopecten yessoensis TaxID=6573 RepID=A0A210PHA9_MIZYE|nr:Acetylcholine receptor subunit alpha-1-A [Mizuhopecten yessoensis]